MDRTIFFNYVHDQPFAGKMTGGQATGCSAILDAWDKFAPKSDPRFIAYSLATAFHETAFTMQPVREIGRGAGRAYGAPAGPFSQVYYGRGYVQETWLANYEFADKRLHALGILTADESLVKTPDLALRADVAAALMIFGMVEGWFTHRKLAEFFVGTRSDWVDARTIINGHDKAAQIAAYGLHFYHAITTAHARAAA